MMNLFSTVLNMSLTASIVILAVCLARLILKKTPKIYSYVLWALVLFRLLCPVSILSPFSVIPDPVTTGEVLSEWSDEYIGEVQIHHDNNIAYETAVEAGRKPISEDEGRFYVVTGSDGISEPKTIENTIMPILSKVWIIGIAALSLYSMISYVRIRKQTRVAVRFRKGIYIADDVTSPFVMGLFHPVIYLPGILDASERRYIIAHERHHIRRGDHIFKALGFLALTIHWFNPLVWLAFNLASQDMEMSCDEAVIQRYGAKVRADYSASLLNLATGHRLLAGTPLAFGEGDPTGRVRNLAKWKKPGFWVILVCIILCVVLAVCLLTNPEAPVPDENERNDTVSPVSTELGASYTEEDSLIEKPHDNADKHTHNATAPGEEKPSEPSGNREEKPSEPSGNREEKPSEPTESREENSTEPSGNKNENPTEPTGNRNENPTEPTGNRNENSSPYVKLGDYKGIQIIEDGLSVYVVGEDFVDVDVPYIDETGANEFVLRYYYSLANPGEDIDINSMGLYGIDWDYPSDEEVARLGIPGITTYYDFEDYIEGKLFENSAIDDFLIISDAVMDQIVAGSAFMEIPEEVMLTCEGIYKDYYEEMLARYNEIGRSPYAREGENGAYKVLAAMAIAQETGIDMDAFDYEEVLKYLVNSKMEIEFTGRSWHLKNID